MLLFGRIASTAQLDIGLGQSLAICLVHNDCTPSKWFSIYFSILYWQPLDFFICINETSGTKQNWEIRFSMLSVGLSLSLVGISLPLASFKMSET